MAISDNKTNSKNLASELGDSDLNELLQKIESESANSNFSNDELNSAAKSLKDSDDLQFEQIKSIVLKNEKAAQDETDRRNEGIRLTKEKAAKSLKYVLIAIAAFSTVATALTVVVNPYLDSKGRDGDPAPYTKDSAFVPYKQALDIQNSLEHASKLINKAEHSKKGSDISLAAKAMNDLNLKLEDVLYKSSNPMYVGFGSAPELKLFRMSNTRLLNEFKESSTNKTNNFNFILAKDFINTYEEADTKPKYKFSIDGERDEKEIKAASEAAQVKLHK